MTASTLLAIAAPHEPPVLSCSREQLAQLSTGIRLTLEQGELTMEYLREMCHGQATGAAAEMLRRFNFGLGHWRECEAELAIAFRAMNAAARKAGI